MVSVLDSESCRPGWGPGDLRFALYKRVFKGVPVNVMLGVTLRWTSWHPMQGGVEILHSLHAKETGIRSVLLGHFFVCRLNLYP